MSLSRAYLSLSLEKLLKDLATNEPLQEAAKKWAKDIELYMDVVIDEKLKTFKCPHCNRLLCEAIQ